MTLEQNRQLIRRFDDAVANCIGLGWQHWLAALRNGKDPSEFISSIDTLARLVQLSGVSIGIRLTPEGSCIRRVGDG